MTVELIQQLPCLGCGQLVDTGLRCLACRAAPVPARTLAEARVVQVWTVEGTPLYARTVREDFEWTSDDWADPRAEAEAFMARQREVYDDLVLSHHSVLYSSRVQVPA